MLSDPFASPKRRIARAKQKIAEIKKLADAFFHGNPYETAIEVNPQRFEEHKVRLTARLPDEITDLAYETIEALRSSLDQALYPIAVKCNVKRPDQIHFPAGNEPADVEHSMGRFKELPPDILALLRGFKPYRAGNRLLWALNMIRRQGMHRLIVPATTMTTGMLVQHMIMTTPTPLDVPPLVWDGMKNEMVFAITSPGSDLHYHLDFGFYIAFGEVEGIAGQPVLGTLDAFAGEAERVVMAIEAEARRLGLIN